jgi:hypothetical protein
VIKDEMADSLQHGWEVQIHTGEPSERRLRAYRFQRLLFRWLDRPLHEATAKEFEDALQDHQLKAELRRLIPHPPTPKTRTDHAAPQEQRRI